MKAAAWMAAVSVLSAITIAYVGNRDTDEIVLGMFGPMVGVAVSWVVTEETYRRDPARLTGVLIAAFAGKMLFFGGYVAVMLKVYGLSPRPFVASFTGYFIALYLVEALLMRQMFAQKRSG